MIIQRRSGNDGVAKYASAENDVNYSVMRVTDMKKKGHDGGKKRGN